MDIISSLAEAIDNSPDNPPKGQFDGVAETLRNSVQKVEDQLSEVCTNLPNGISDPISQLVGAGGKRARPMVCILSHLALKENSPDTPIGLATAAELIHSATLLHDDVVDEGTWRRGAPAVRVSWGNAASIIGGDYLLAYVLKMVSSFDSEVILSSLIKVLMDMADAEALQLTLRGSLNSCEENYFKVIKGKTAGLFAWCAEAGAVSANASQDEVKLLAKFGESLGMCFQMIDDLLDLKGDPDSIGKDVLLDISEGKITLPVLKALEEKPTLAGLIEKACNNSDSTDPKIIEEIRGLILASHGVEKTQKAAAEAAAGARDALSFLPSNPARDGLLSLTRLLLHRTA